MQMQMKWRWQSTASSLNLGFDDPPKFRHLPREVIMIFIDLLLEARKLDHLPERGIRPEITDLDFTL
jgi:hypothetical protein